MPSPSLAILAPGLLGASVAMAARARGAASTIRIWARRPETRLEVHGQPWCDSVHPTPAEAVADADLVVLCTPVDQIARLVAEIAPALKPGALVTDVGSVKASVCREAAAALGADGRRRFIGSHPMAGSEKTGWEAGSATLFEKRTCFVTPFPEADPADVDRVASFWHALGAKLASATPDAHDEIVASISHLPHVAAAALCATLGAAEADWRPYAGNGLRDTTRIASGDPGMWLAILDSNRDEVLRALRRYEDTLHQIHTALANRDWVALRGTLARAKSYRDGLV